MNVRMTFPLMGKYWKITYATWQLALYVFFASNLNCGQRVIFMTGLQQKIYPLSTGGGPSRGLEGHFSRVPDPQMGDPGSRSIYDRDDK